MSRVWSAGLPGLGRAVHRLGRLLAPLAQLPFVAWGYALVQWLSPRRPFIRSVQLDGYTMQVSILDCSVSQALLVKRSWEPLTTRLFQELCKPGMVVVDAGAQLGYYALLAATLVGPNGRVIAFEPDKRHLRPLRASVGANGLENVIVVPFAVSNTTGRIPLKVNAAAPARFVPAVRLDDCFEAAEHVDFIKMDIDGGESEALHGMKDLLARSPTVMMLVEYDRWQHEAANRSPQAFLDQLRETGLELGLVIDEEAGTARRMDWAALAEVRASVNVLLHSKGDGAALASVLPLDRSG